MSRSKRRDEMLRLLRRKAREGLTYRELIAETGLCRSTLTAWAAKLRRELERDAKAEHAFVELVAAPDEAPAGAPIELVVNDRHVIRVRADFDEVALHRLLRALAAC